MGRQNTRTHTFTNPLGVSIARCILPHSHLMTRLSSGPDGSVHVATAATGQITCDRNEYLKYHTAIHYSGTSQDQNLFSLYQFVSSQRQRH